MEIAMKQRIATWAATITALACASPLRAHHSISMFEVSAPIWVKGTVVRYEPKDPHVMIADPLARRLWCGSQTYVVASIASKPFVDEINRLMANPCH
jgi:hypothetical protein